MRKNKKTSVNDGITEFYENLFSRNNKEKFQNGVLKTYFIENVQQRTVSKLCKHQWLTLKHQEMHGCVVSTVATDALVLKHQAISILNAEYTFIVLDQFSKAIEYYTCGKQHQKINLYFET